MTVYTRKDLNNLLGRFTLMEFFQCEAILTRDFIRECGVYRTNCPFCDHENTTFKLLDDNKTYLCDFCGATGDAVQYMIEVERKSFSESIQILERLFPSMKLDEIEACFGVSDANAT